MTRWPVACRLSTCRAVDDGMWPGVPAAARTPARRERHEPNAGGRARSRGRDRVVDLDEATLGALLSHQRRQGQQRDEWGTAWVDSGHVFTKEDGSALHPETVSQRFRELSDAAGLRPVRLRDLRHGQASPMLAAGVPMAVVSKGLGHSSLAITSDTHSHLLEGVGQPTCRHRRNGAGTAHRPPNPE